MHGSVTENGQKAAHCKTVYSVRPERFRGEDYFGVRRGSGDHICLCRFVEDAERICLLLNLLEGIKEDQPDAYGRIVRGESIEVKDPNEDDDFSIEGLFRSNRR